MKSASRGDKCRSSLSRDNFCTTKHLYKLLHNYLTSRCPWSKKVHHDDETKSPQQFLPTKHMKNVSQYVHFDMLHEEEFSCHYGSYMQKAISAFANRLNTGFSARSAKTYNTEQNYFKIIEEHIHENVK